VKLIAYSREDVAGGNIARILKESFGFKENGGYFDDAPVCGRGDVLLVESAESILYRNDFDSLSPEFMVVASRHRSESGEPTLTAHATGNFGNADFGGLPGRLSLAPARILRQAIELLKLNVGSLPYKVSLEVTHHGPTELPFPLAYVEVGSTEKEWRDEAACLIAAEVIDKLVSELLPPKPSAIGFGGTHYAPNFTEITHNVALGHIAPKYAIEHVDKAMVEHMIERTTPKPELAVLDWKGLKSEEKKEITSILEKNGVQWQKTSDLKDYLATF
jgi:D-aminoacyl-tRNA deacylase